MMKLAVIKSALTRMTGRSGLLLQKHSPEIFMVVGVGCIITSTILACRATLKVEDVIDEAKEKLEMIRHGHETISKEKYSDEDYKKDLVIQYTQSAVKFIKLYGPSVLIGTVGIGCILGSHGIMRKRNFALVAAYKAVETSFQDYRKRVIEEFGVDKDRMLKNGIVQSKISVLEVDENGKTKKSQQIVESCDPNGLSQYARFFDEGSVNWSKTPEYNLMFLKSQQNYANDLLLSRGHIFLNEVYDLIGIPRSQAGQVVGWVKGTEEAFGDGFVDFGFFDGTNQRVREFVNGSERSILLDFNVDGVVYDMI